MKGTLEMIFGGLIGLAVVSVLVTAQNSPGVINSVFSGTTNLFGTIDKGVGATG